MLVNDKLKELRARFRNAGMDCAETDADVLVAHALSVEKYRLYMDNERILSEKELKVIEGFAKRRENFEPVAYITGNKEFYSLDFKVTPDVLIPRPETELLVDMAIYYCPQNSVVLDLCTGSGAVAVAFKYSRNDSEVWATDISGAALEVAKYNAEQILGKDSVHFLEGDLFSTVGGMKFDLIISNPPYVDREIEHTLQKDLCFEPDLALYSEDQGREITSRIIDHAGGYLSENGILLLEIGEKMKDYVKDAGVKKGFTVSTLNDYAGLPRVAVLKS